MVNATPRPFTTGNYQVPVVLEAGCVPGPFWTDAGNLFPSGIHSPYRPARSQSVYQLRDHGQLLLVITVLMVSIITISGTCVDKFNNDLRVINRNKIFGPKRNIDYSYLTKTQLQETN